MMKWKPIKGYEGYYEISNTGAVRSAISAGRYGRQDGWKLLKPTPDKNKGYYIVSLCKNGTVKPRRVAILVLETFVGKRPKGGTVVHKNGILTDHSLRNLFWGSRIYRSKNQGEQHPLASLTKRQVIAMRKNYKGREGDLAKLAEKYNTTKGNVWAIVNRKSWTHV